MDIGLLLIPPSLASTSFAFSPGRLCAGRKWTPLAANPDLSLLIHHGASSSPGADYGYSPPLADEPATPDNRANKYITKLLIFTHRWRCDIDALREHLKGTHLTVGKDSCTSFK